MDLLYQDIMVTCDIMGIPLEEANYWFEAYTEFVREEFDKRINGSGPLKINTQIVWDTVLKGLVREYEVN